MTAKYLTLKFALVCMPMLGACADDTTQLWLAAGEPKPEESISGAASSREQIKINQLGYLPRASKLAVVPDVTAARYLLRSAVDDSIVYIGDLTPARRWSPAGGEPVKQADFSAFVTEGEYYLSVEGVADSEAFSVGDDVYLALHDAVLKAYYFNRASTALEEAHAGVWARPAGHPDTRVRVHASAATEARPAGTEVSAPKGWYDAGDFGKYTVNSGISVFTLLTSYQHFPSLYEGRDVNVPESGDSVPDILDEVKWNLDWLSSMQDEDGSVYHKLSGLAWPGEIMPALDNAPRFVIGKSTTAALNFVAVMALASRVYADHYPAEAARWLSQATRAWDWASANPSLSYSGGADGDGGSGRYGDDVFSDELSWAAAEMYLATEEQRFLDAFRSTDAPLEIPIWRRVGALPLISLVDRGADLMNPAEHAELSAVLIDFADTIVAQYEASAYAVPMEDADFRWGSNGQAANKAFVVLQAYRETGDPAYERVAMGVLSYLLGRNATDYSFVTGFGHKTPVDIHHRQSRADGVVEPVPGFLAGGPHDGQQDDCSYPSTDNAKSYLDGWCSYSTNEVTINWNAPLLYTIAALSVR